MLAFADLEEMVGVDEDEIGRRWGHVGLVVVFPLVEHQLLINFCTREAVSLVE